MLGDRIDSYLLRFVELLFLSINTHGLISILLKCVLLLLMTLKLVLHLQGHIAILITR